MGEMKGKGRGAREAKTEGGGATRGGQKLEGDERRRMEGEEGGKKEKEGGEAARGTH